MARGRDESSGSTPSHDPDQTDLGQPNLTRRDRARAQRRFLGEVNDLEHRPLLSGMTLDSTGLNFIAAHELGPAGDQAGTFSATSSGPVGGFASAPYTDAAGNAVIGYGHLLHEGKVDAADQAKYPNPIDQSQATSWLSAEAAKAADAVNKDVKVSLTQDQFDALVDFTLNEGADAFDKSALLQDVNAKKFGRVPGQFDQWVYGIVNGTKAVIPGLVERRNDESNLFEGHVQNDSSGGGAATGFSAGHPGNTLGGIHSPHCSPGSGQKGSGGGNGTGGGGFTAGGRSRAASQTDHHPPVPDSEFRLHDL